MRRRTDSDDLPQRLRPGALPIYVDDLTAPMDARQRNYREWWRVYGRWLVKRDAFARDRGWLTASGDPIPGTPAFDWLIDPAVIPDEPFDPNDI